jgi:hypothetical protein
MHVTCNSSTNDKLIIMISMLLKYFESIFCRQSES